MVFKMYFATIVAIVLIHLIIRIVRWRLRIAHMRRAGMTVIPVIVPPDSHLRLFLPKKYQTFHFDWPFQQLDLYDILETEVIALIPLFSHDTFYISDPGAAVEIATNPTRFPKALYQYSMPSFEIRALSWYRDS